MVSWVFDKALPPCCPVSHLADFMFCSCQQLHLIVGGLWSFSALSGGCLAFTTVLYSLPAGCVALSSWNLGPLPDCLALPLDQLIAWQWLLAALSICWPACIASLFLSVWLCMGIGLLLPCPLLQVPGIVFLLSASADFVELLFCCLAHLLNVWYCFSNLLNVWQFSSCLFTWSLTVMSPCCSLSLLTHWYLLFCHPVHLLLCLAFLSYCPTHLPRFYF